MNGRKRPKREELLTDARFEREPDVKRKKISDKTAENEKLHSNVLKDVASAIFKDNSANILRFSLLDQTCRHLAESKIRNTEQIIVDAHEIFSSKYFDSESDAKDIREFHQDVESLIKALETLSCGLKDSKLQLVNLNPSSVHWIFLEFSKGFKRCPERLQKRIVALYRHFFHSSQEFKFNTTFLRPTRFLRCLKYSMANVTKLDLSNMKSTPSLNLNVNLFPKLVNLKDFYWNKADTSFIEALPSPHLLEKLSLTMPKDQIDVQFMRLLLNCQGLKFLNTGYVVPINPTRFDMEILIRNYQLFWNMPQYQPEDMIKRNDFIPVTVNEEENEGKIALAVEAFPSVDHICFWNAPEYLFIIMSRRNIQYKTLQFGTRTQSLSQLCSFDSIMQTFFKSSLPRYDMGNLVVTNLKLNLHAMPLVPLDYYFPQLMDSIGNVLPRIKTLDLFVRCLFNASMTESWSLTDTRSKRRVLPKLHNLTHFSLHIDGFCVLDDLETHLPVTLTSLSLSFVIPQNKRRAFLTSLSKFIGKLRDFNMFPDLEEVHIQIWGIRCFEVVLNELIANCHSVKAMSIICMPISNSRDHLIESISNAIDCCKNLSTLNLSADLVNFLSGYSSTDKYSAHQWKDCLHDIYSKCVDGRPSLLIGVDCLPRSSDVDTFVVLPQFPDVIEETEEEEEEEERSHSGLTDDEEEEDDEDQDSENLFVEEDDESENDSFVADDEEEEELGESSEDELDEAERKLERETTRRNNREDKRVRIESECVSEGSNTDVIVFKKYSKEGDSDEDGYWEDEEEEENNPFVDNEAVESSGEEGEDEETEEEPDDPNTDDEELFDAAIDLVNIRNKKVPPKRKKIIIESDED